jgi:hypothetical protein
MENRTLRLLKVAGQQVYCQKGDMYWQFGIFVRPVQTACGKAQDMHVTLHKQLVVKLRICTSHCANTVVLNYYNCRCPLHVKKHNSYVWPMQNTTRVFEPFCCFYMQTDKILLHLKVLIQPSKITRITAWCPKWPVPQVYGPWRQDCWPMQAISYLKAVIRKTIL